MRKRIALAAVLVLLLCLSGCASWFSASRYSIAPHRQGEEDDPGGNLQIATYIQLQEELVRQAGSGAQSAVLYFPGIQQSRIPGMMDSAIRYLTTVDPIGAYAVDAVTYEVGTSTGIQAVAVDFQYHRTRTEILRLPRLTQMEQVAQAVYDSLDNCDPGTVFYISQYQHTDFAQLVQDYVDENPQECMELPQVSVTVYPDYGSARVVELTYTYQTSRDVLRNLKQQVRPVFSSAELYVTGGSDVWQKYLQLFAFLMERHDYTLETSLTPAYSLLIHGVGDSKAFATVYGAMCRQAGLDCQVVSGTSGGEPWFWNVILYDGVYYHLDLLRCSWEGAFSVKTEEEMNGYVWDYAQYQSQPQPEPESLPTEGQ